MSEKIFDALSTHPKTFPSLFRRNTKRNHFNCMNAGQYLPLQLHEISRAHISNLSAVAGAIINQHSIVFELM